MYEATTARRAINREKKAWEFIRDVNSMSSEDLEKIAIQDGVRRYSYEDMFREWERYASVFSCLGITGENQSRVGILGSTCAEVVFASYGLNMVGADVSIIAAYGALFPNNVTKTIRDENLTDFIITDDFAQANLINELFMKKDELGLKNIILLHAPVTGITVEPPLTMAQETKYRQWKGWYGPICMDRLLAVYGNYPINYASEENSDTAVILHTSGTTSGGGNPVALSDKAINEAAACFYEIKDISLPYDNLVSAVIVDLSNAYAFIDQIHLPFAMGASVTFVPWGILNPNYHRAISHYGITFLFAVSALFERWMKMPDQWTLDFSSLSFVVLGGAAVSAADKRRYYKFLQEHGAGDIILLNGYGISELGGACCLSTPDLDDESIGYPLPGVNVRLYDDENGSFLPADLRPSEGVLYLNSPSVATIMLDDKEIMKVEYVDGEPYICTNDLVRVDEDGRINFLGRANRYFINEEGRKYESGRVETEFSRQPDIESCCVVPVYIKVTHDNIPMLAVKTLEAAGDALEVVHKALKNVFLDEKTLLPDLLPYRVLIAKDLPRNRNGKIDLYKISKGEVEGPIFTVEAIRIGDTIKDFLLKPYQEGGPTDMIKEVMDGMSGAVKDNMPFGNKMTNNIKEEVTSMNDNAQKAFESFSNMQQMRMQMMNDMMKNMMNGMPNMNQGNNGANAPFFGMPGMQGMPGMPDMQKMMENMQGMMPGMQGMPGMPDMQQMMPDMQKMMEDMQTMMPMPGMMPDMQMMMDNMKKMNTRAVANAKKMRPDGQLMMENMKKMNKKAADRFDEMTPDMKKMFYVMESMCKTAADMMPTAEEVTKNMQEMAELMGTAMQQQFGQMMQCVSQMNRIGFEAVQKNIELNRKMTELFIGSMQKIADTDWDAEKEKAEEAADKKLADEEKKAKAKKEKEKKEKAKKKAAKEADVETVAAEDVTVEPAKEEKPAKTTRGRKPAKADKKEEKAEETKNENEA